MKTRFSQSTGVFYPFDIDYVYLPADIIDVEIDDYNAAMARPAGHTFDFVDGKLVIAPPAPPTAGMLKAMTNASLLAQIESLEKGQARAVREATIGMAGAVDRLKTLDAKIADLRTQIIK